MIHSLKSDAQFEVNADKVTVRNGTEKPTHLLYVGGKWDIDSEEK